MCTIQRDVDSAIMRYQQLVWTGERRALRIAEHEPQPAASGNVGRQVANWLNAQWANLGRTLTHASVAPVHSKQPVG